jgi:hypothetical protein
MIPTRLPAQPDPVIEPHRVVELAEATSYLLVEFATQHGLLADS